MPCGRSILAVAEEVRDASVSSDGFTKVKSSGHRDLRNECRPYVRRAVAQRRVADARELVGPQAALLWLLRSCRLRAQLRMRSSGLQ